MVTRLLRGQSSIEYLLLIALAGTLTLAIAASTSSQLNAQAAFSLNVTDQFGRIANWSETNLGTTNSSSNSSPRLDLRLDIPEPVYSGEPVIAQATVFNYGAQFSVPILQINATQNGLMRSSLNKTNIPVYFSFTENVALTPSAPGTFEVSAALLDANGSLLRGSDGEALFASRTILVLTNGGGASENPIVFIQVERSDEEISYPLASPAGSVIYPSLITAPQGDGGSCAACPPKPHALWRYVSYSPSGSAMRMCACVYEKAIAEVFQIQSTGEPRFALSVAAANEANESASFVLGDETLSTETDFGTASLGNPPTAIGESPAVESVAVIEAGSGVLRSSAKYADYRAAQTDFETRLSMRTADCAYDCQGALTAMGVLMEKTAGFLASASVHSCSVNSSSVSCKAQNFIYPSVKLVLNESFAGAPIPQGRQFVDSGVTVEVRTR